MSETIYPRTISREEWEDYFKGWLVTDCAILDRHLVLLVARQDLPEEEVVSLFDSEVPTRFIRVFLDGERGYGRNELGGFGFPKCGVSRKPVAQGLLVNQNDTGQVFARGRGDDTSTIEKADALIEEIYPRGGSGDLVSVQRIKCINGWAYAVSMFRQIFKRTGIGRWLPINEGFTHEYVKQGPSAAVDVGFEDIDGPDENNLYAVGGVGDVWRYDGSRWRLCDFPSNRPLHTVCVAPNGDVYITDRLGSLWVGREDAWKQLHKGASTIPYNDTLWFEDQLWLCSDYQLHVWDGKTLDRPRQNGQTLVYSGYMDAYDGLLVVASAGSVYAYDSHTGNWHTLVRPYS